MSLGDQRRLEIARAIVSRPQLILLDEPVSGVAVEEAHRLRELLLAINRELGIAMVVIEHNIGFLVSLCQRISVMSEGRIIAEGMRPSRRQRSAACAMPISANGRRRRDPRGLRAARRERGR